MADPGSRGGLLFFLCAASSSEEKENGTAACPMTDGINPSFMTLQGIYVRPCFLLLPREN
jgi:hypothetical protein